MALTSPTSSSRSADIIRSPLSVVVVVYAQEPAIGPYREPDLSSTHSIILLRDKF